MIIFSEAQSLGYLTNFNYVGDVFNYNNSSTINIKGRMQSDRNFDGISYINDNNITFNGLEILYNGYNLIYGSSSTSGTNGDYSPLFDIWNNMSSVRSGFTDFQIIVLNDINIGSGRLTKLIFPESRDPRVSTYEAEIQLYKSGNLYNLTGQPYENIEINNEFCKYVSNLDEDFVMSKSADGTISYDRSLNFDCIDANFTGSDFINGVKNFASGIIFNDPAFQATVGQYPAFYENQGSRFFTESYDAIQGSFSFSEKFQGPNSGQGYKLTNSMSLNLQNEGFSTVSEKGTIMGVQNNTLTSAYLGMNSVESSIYGRVSDFYANYIGTGTCSSGLFLKSKNKVINKEAGIINYSFEYSNDPFSLDGYEISRELQISKSEVGVYTISEQGAVKNNSAATNPDKLLNSINYFNNNISGGINNRVFDLYSNQASGCGCSGDPISSDLRKISTENVYSDFNGLFSYNYIFRNDCTSLVNGSFFTNFEKEISKSTHKVFLGVTPYNGEISQYQNQSSLVDERQSISVVSNTTGKVIEDYLDVALAKIQIPNSQTFFMNSANYSFDPDNSKLTMNIGYNYTGYRSYADADV